MLVQTDAVRSKMALRIAKVRRFWVAQCAFRRSLFEEDMLRMPTWDHVGATDCVRHLPCIGHKMWSSSGQIRPDSTQTSVDSKCGPTRSEMAQVCPELGHKLAKSHACGKPPMASPPPTSRTSGPCPTDDLCNRRASGDAVSAWGGGGGRGKKWRGATSARTRCTHRPLDNARQGSEFDEYLVVRPALLRGHAAIGGALSSPTECAPRSQCVMRPATSLAGHPRQ